MSRKVNYIFLLITGILLVFGEKTANSQICNNSVPVPSLPFNQNGLTNCGMGNPGIPSCLSSNYFGGHSYLFKYTPSVDQCVKSVVSISSPATYSGFAILNACPSFAGAACIAKVSGINKTSYTLNNVSLIGGTTYYFMVSGGKLGSQTTYCMGFDIKIMDCSEPCMSAPEIISLPYSVTGQTTCGSGSGFSGTPACLNSLYFGGEQKVFKYMSTKSKCINATITLPSYVSRSGFAILDNCPTDAGANCIASTTGSALKVMMLNEVYLSPGVTYYFIVSGGATSSSGYCMGFDMSITSCNYAPISSCQSACTNMDFEMNSFYGWAGTSGEVDDGPKGTYPMYKATAVGVPSVQHTIMTGGTDPHGGFPRVFPGGSYSVRLGDYDEARQDGISGSKGATLEQTFTVTPSNANFTYRYAAVIEDPSHSLEDQPFLKIDMFDSDGDVIACAPYMVVAGKNIPNFFPSLQCLLPTACNVYYRPWTSSYVDLSNYIGQCVTIRYTVGDCTAGGHFCYVYLDNTCQPMEILGPDSICAGQQAILTAPDGAVTYSWSTGATTQNITVAPTSTTIYSVTMTSSTSCTITLQDTVHVIPQPAANFTATPTGGCNNIYTFNNISTGANAYTWNLGDGSPLINLQNPVDHGYSSGTYTITLIASNLVCTDTSAITITINTPSITVNTDTICQGSSAILTAKGGESYVWSTGETGSSVVVNPVVTTSYSVTGTVSGCTAQAIAVVTVNPPCGLNLNATSATICNGTCATITATANSGVAPYAFFWSNGETTTSISACPVTTTSYTVTVTDNAGSTASAITSINVNPEPAINVPSGEYCEGLSVNLTATGADSYTWSPATNLSSSTGNSIVANPPVTTTYTVTGTIIATGCTGSSEVVVMVNPNPVISIAGSSICDGTTGSLTATTTGGVPGYAYEWSNGQNSVTVSGVTSGTYSVTVTDQNGCSATADAVISQSPRLVVSALNASMCANSSATLTAVSIGGAGAVNFSWNPGAFTGTTVLVQPAVTTTYTLTGTDVNGCTGSGEVLVTVNPLPIVSVNGAVICEGDVAALQAFGAQFYTWVPLNGLSAGNGNTVNANPATTTTYTVTGNPSGCSASMEVVVTVNQKPILTATGGNACPGDSIILSVSGADNYSWMPATGLNNNNMPMVMALIPVTTTYTVVGTTLKGCSSSAEAIATLNPVPTAAFSSRTDETNVIEPTVYFTDISIGATNWLWAFGDANSSVSILQHPVFVYPDTGTYAVQLIVSNNYGCLDTVTSGITAILEGFTFYVPNSFTPDADGLNDGFAPKGSGIDETGYHLWIYDRWGELIWQTEKWGEQWDGKANNGSSPAQIDAYVWKVQVREKHKGTIHNYIGHVNIIR